MSIGSFDTKNISTQTTIIWWVVVLTAFGFGLFSLLSPPPGKIDDSVLDFIGWLFAFATVASARECIKEGLGVKIRHKNTEFEVNK